MFFAPKWFMKRIIGIVFLLVYAGFVQAQGCADAGFCTAGVLKSGLNTNTIKDIGSAGLSTTIGYGEQGTIAIIPQLELSKSINKNGVAEIKLPYYIASGKLGTYSGVSDVVATVTQLLWKSKEVWDVRAVLGGRFSLGQSDKVGATGLALPMPYQPNLGTTDLIAGINISWKKYFRLALGVQAPLFNYNNNGYLAGTVPGASADYDVYFSSRKLERKADALLRLEIYKNSQKHGLSFSPLFIYHVADDNITLLNGVQAKVNGSAGLTLNLIFDYFRDMGNWRAELSVGAPVVVRANRPEGLTRAAVVTPRLTYYFRKK